MTNQQDTLDEWVDELLDDFYLEMRDVATSEYNSSRFDIAKEEVYAEARQAIRAKYISRKEVEEAIGEDENLQMQASTYPAYHEETIRRGSRNELRAELRAKLLPPTKGGNDE